MVSTAAIGAALALGSSGAGADPTALSGSDVIKALTIIQHDADAIAAGKYHGKSLQAPAHQIGIQWYKVEPTLAKNGAVLVETRMANQAITAFDKTWKQNGKARDAAKDVSSSVGDLLAVRKVNPPAAASPRASAAAAPASPSASAGPAASPAANTSAKPAESPKP